MHGKTDISWKIVYNCTTKYENRPCVFPFVHENVTYFGCTDVPHPQQTSGFWCNIDIPDARGFSGSTSVSECDNSCPGGKQKSFR